MKQSRSNYVSFGFSREWGILYWCKHDKSVETSNILILFQEKRDLDCPTQIDLLNFNI